MCDFHSQSQGMCWYFRTALETLSTQIETRRSGESDQPPSRKETIGHFGVRIWQWIYVEFIWQPGIWHHDRTISWRQMHKTIIFCLNLARQLQTNNKQTRTQNRPTCWQLASEVDPHGPSCAVPSGLRFWLAVDHRTNDSSSVCGICEAYDISTRCESLYPKCNRISSNKSMNVTPYSPIPRRQRHFVDLSTDRIDPAD